MSRKKRNVQTAACQRHQAITPAMRGEGRPTGPRHAKALVLDTDDGMYHPKPEPPSDLWERMDDLLKSQNSRPADTFTCSEFAKRYGIAASTARAKILRLISEGKVVQLGTEISKNGGRHPYYGISPR
jgi:hypothetical protein